MDFEKLYIVKPSETEELRVNISVTLDNICVDSEKVLSEFAKCSRNFYLEFGRRLTDKDSQ